MIHMGDKLMKKLADRLKRVDITLAKGYMKWYSVIDNELRLFINERGRDDKGSCITSYIGKRIELSYV